MFLLTFCHKKCHLSNNRLFYPCFDDVAHTKILCLLVRLTFPFTLNDSLAAWFRLPPPRRSQLQQRSLALTQLCLRKCKCVQRNPVWTSVIAFNATPVWESVNAFNATLCAVWNKTACTKSPTSWCSTLYAMNGRKYYWPFRFPLKGQDNEMGFHLWLTQLSEEMKLCAKPSSQRHNGSRRKRLRRTNQAQTTYSPYYY